MSRITDVAFIGNELPRLCGIATFTHDLHHAISASRPGMQTTIVAMTDHGRTYDYPPQVRFQIQDHCVDDYYKAADFLNRSTVQAVSLQHEFGIFGGEAGGHIIELVSRLRMPIIATLHTILATPSAEQYEILRQIIALSAKVVVMAEKGRTLLRSVYSAPSDKIEVIPHGIPDVPFTETHQAKAQFGFINRSVILTFGLLSPNKGIEIMIDAMPSIMECCPNAVYVVLGATHPNLVQEQGEAYRGRLVARVKELGIEANVVFINKFVDQEMLLNYISMCDVYVTPYLNESQMTSGTLAYSFGLGKAVVSTPYWHARELLSEGRGILVPFADTKAVGKEISSLLTNDVRRQAMRKRAYAASRSMTWEQTAYRYLSVIDGARPADLHRKQAPTQTAGLHEDFVAPELSLGHLLSMCDGTGILQHAVQSVPNRSHGYCVDDNARALILACSLGDAGEPCLAETLTVQFAAFVQHAWNQETRRFRNFMSYERLWLEDQGSEDSHGRVLWSLGVCAASDVNIARRRWAAQLFETALPSVEEFQSPRAWAFTLLGLDAYCAAHAREPAVNRIRGVMADRLMSLFSVIQTPSWAWFEDSLAYDNARLSQALIQTGMATANLSHIAAGIGSLRWLMSAQTSEAGFFRPIGTESFGLHRNFAQKFDQQPVEAAATIAACFAAWRASEDVEWVAGALRAFRWFQGDNDLSISLINQMTGSCSDGLHPDRSNENNGAESLLSYLLGASEIRKFFQALAEVKPPKATSSLSLIA